MEKFKSIEYDYNHRTTRYTFYLDNILDIKKAIINLVGKSFINVIFFKEYKTRVEIKEFFLLELYYVFKLVKSDYPEFGINIGGIFLNNIIEFLETQTWLCNRRDVDTKKLFNLKNITTTMKYEPLEHQIAGFNKYEEIKQISNLSGYVLDAKPGTGKTYMSLALGELLEYDTIIIVAPKNTLFEVWKDSVSESLFKVNQSHIVLGSESDSYNNEKYIITHYEYIKKLLNNKKLIRKLKRLKPYLIIDEFHNFNEIKSERTQLLRKFVTYMKFDDIALLTGTPLKMKLKELVPMLYILDDKFPKSQEDFLKFYSNIYGVKQELIQYRFNLYRERIDKDIEGRPDIEILEYKVSLKNGNDYTTDNIDRRMEEYKENRLLELESNMDKHVNDFEQLLSISKKNMIYKKEENVNNIFKSYQTYVKTIRKHSNTGKLYLVYDIVNKATELEKMYILKNLDGVEKRKFRDVSAIVKYPKLKVLGEALGKILLGSRISCYNDLAKKINYENILKITHKKGLVFSNFVSVCENVMNECKREGYKPVGVYGDLVNELNTTVKKFNDLSTEYNPIVATYKSLSTGVPLTSANVLIIIDSALKNYILEQAISRSFRLGNNDKVTVLFVKLDTGTDYNITNRDTTILHNSIYNVELITGNKPIFDIPKNSVDFDITEEELTEDVKEIVDDIATTSFMEITNDMNHDLLDYIKKILKKITFK